VWKRKKLAKLLENTYQIVYNKLKKPCQEILELKNLKKDKFCCEEHFILNNLSVKNYTLEKALVKIRINNPKKDNFALISSVETVMGGYWRVFLGPYISTLSIYMGKKGKDFKLIVKDSWFSPARLKKRKLNDIIDFYFKKWKGESYKLAYIKLVELIYLPYVIEQEIINRKETIEQEIINKKKSLEEVKSHMKKLEDSLMNSFVKGRDILSLYYGNLDNFVDFFGSLNEKGKKKVISVLLDVSQKRKQIDDWISENFPDLIKETLKEKILTD